MTGFDCDVLVVGAGPAGTSAALAAARGGARVTVVERRPVVGVPVRCAEYVPAQLVGDIGLGRQFIVQAVDGMHTRLAGRLIQQTPAAGFVIRRDIFDQTLAAAARAAGADLRLATRAVARPDRQTVLLRRAGGDLQPIRTRVIIGADGPRSAVARWIEGGGRRCLPGVQVQAQLNRPMAFTEVYFEPEIFAGYGWLFPKGAAANVGLACLPHPHSPRKIRCLLKAFVERLRQTGRIQGPLGPCTAGWIPVAPLANIVSQNILLAGDAAGHCHPITGAGVSTAVLAGRMAGKWAARASRARREAMLRAYAGECREMFGPSLDRALRRRRVLELQWSRLEEIIAHCWVAFRSYYAGA